MTKARKIKDGIKQGFIYLASSITFIILLSIFAFIFITGKDTLSIDMIRNNYWSENYLVSVPDKQVSFTLERDLKATEAFSERYGVVFEDYIDFENQSQLRVSGLSKGSLFLASKDLSIGDNTDDILKIEVGSQIEKLEVVNKDGSIEKFGMIYNTSASELAKSLDAAASIKSVYFISQGGGIWGSLIATLKLIGISLLIALPLGIFTAIYLNEIAKKNKLTKAMESSIELLAGVPSIIFGLMGVIVLYPITTLFNIDGLSIFLGGLTMAVVLLPVVIRSVTESLKTVPNGLRMASLSLGASKSQTIFKIILPSAIPGILSAVLLAISRIIGESAALIYTMGTFINDSPKLSEGATSLAVHIWSLMSQEQPNFELASAISIIILAMVLVLNISVKLISKRLDRKLGY